MLATSSYTTSATHAFLPAIPSPLSPRSANIYGRHPAPLMSSSTSDAIPPKGSKQVPFAQRPVKKAPSPKADAVKERRRNLFLKKVKDDRDARRFEARGEDMMRLDFMQRRRQWEAEQAREASQIPSDAPEEASELPTSSSAMQTPAPESQNCLPAEEEVDEVAQREDGELAELLSFMPNQDADEERGAADQQSEHFGSDDLDYDELFSELMRSDMIQERENEEPLYSQEHEAMDLS